MNIWKEEERKILSVSLTSQQFSLMDLCSLLAPRHSDKLDLTVTFAQSLDGKLAGKGGTQIALSCPESMQMTHRLRTMHDAILVGINTVLNDNPQLNSLSTLES